MPIVAQICSWWHMPHKDAEKRKAYAREYYRRWREKYPEKTRKANADYRERNLDARRAQDRETKARKRSAGDVGLRLAKERDYAKHREQRVATIHRWQRQNMDKVRNYRHRRRARVRGAFVAHVDFAEIWLRDAGRCQLCGGDVARNEASLDHIVPLALGGTHEPPNVQLAHRLCNIRRQDMPIERFQQRLKATTTLPVSLSALHSETKGR